MDGEGGIAPSPRPARGGSGFIEQRPDLERGVRRGVGVSWSNPRRNGERLRGRTVLRGGAPVLPRLLGTRAGERGASLQPRGPPRGSRARRGGDRRVRRRGVENPWSRRPRPPLGPPAPGRPGHGRSRARGRRLFPPSIRFARLARGGSRGVRPPPRPPRGGRVSVGPRTPRRRGPAPTPAGVAAPLPGLRR